MLGFFDENIVVEGWFAPEAQAIAWFDANFLDQVSLSSGYFGFNSVGGAGGGSTDNYGDTQYVGTKFTAPNLSGSIDFIEVEIGDTYGGGFNQFTVFLFSVDAFGKPDTLLATGSSASLSNVFGFQACNIAYNFSPNEELVAKVWADVTYTLSYDAGATDQSTEKYFYTYPTVESPETSTNQNLWAREYAIRIHYTTSGGGGSVLTESLADSLTLSDSNTSSFTKRLADAITLNDSLSKAIAFNRADSITLNDSLTKALTVLFGDTMNLADAVSAIKAITQSVSDTFTLNDAIAKALNYRISDSLTLNDALVQSLVKRINDAFNLGDNLTKSVSKIIADTISLSDTATKSVNIKLADSFTISDAITAYLARLVQVSDSVTLADANVKALNLVIADQISIADAYTKDFYIGFTDTIGLTESQKRSINVLIADVVTINEELTRAAQLRLDDNITLSDDLLIVLGQLFYSILKRYDAQSGLWKKAKLQIYLDGAWVDVPLMLRKDNSWKAIDTTGE